MICLFLWGWGLVWEFNFCLISYVLHKLYLISYAWWLFTVKDFPQENGVLFLNEEKKFFF